MIKMVDTDYSKKKVAVVLSGGSAKGFAHIGVLRGLEEMGINPSLIVGTSMGAIVGGLYCWNPNSRWVEAEIKKHGIRDILSFKEFLNLKKGLFRGNVFEAKYREIIGNAEFRDLKIPLVINAADVVTGKTFTFTKGRVAEAVRASASVPLVFNPLIKGGKILVDGGLTENIYFRYLVPRARRYDLIILVDVTVKINRFKRDPSVFGIVMQCLSIMMSRQMEFNFQLLKKDQSPKARLFCSRMICITPLVQDMSVARFDKVDEAIKKGYEAFSRSRGKIRSMLKSGV
jgi:NTE family protein